MTLTFEQAIERLKPKYELVYVDYDDCIADKDVQAVLDYDWEVLEDIDHWAAEQRWDSAEREFDYEFEPEERADLGEEGCREVIDRIMECDNSDYYGQLIRHTSNPLLRIQAMDEDLFMLYEPLSASDVLDALNFPKTDRNLALVRDTLANCGDGARPYWLLSANLETLWGISSESLVRITNPHLFLGSSYSGSGWFTEEPLEGTITVKRLDLTTDKAAAGYSVTDIFGGLVVSAFECDVQELKVEEAIAELRVIEKELR